MAIIRRGYAFDDVLLIPRYTNIDSRKNVNFKTKVTKNYFLDIPILAANMDTICESKMAITLGKLGGLGPIHRFLSIKEQVKEVNKVKKQNLISAAAIGVKDYQKRVEALSKVGVEILLLDIAHGHSKKAGKVLKWIKKEYPHLDVMAGNVATKDSADYLLSQGADAIKVGIGPGSMCTTRLMSGVGVPQITAIMDVREVTPDEIPLCGDGGIKYPGDITKAIGAGANTVMLGSILAGTNETPGRIINEKGKEYKLFRGMASYDATIKKLKLDGKKHLEVISVEGEKTKVKLKGPIEKIIKQFLGGLASGMTYFRAKSIDELCGKADFIEISQAGKLESMAHGVKN